MCVCVLDCIVALNTRCLNVNILLQWLLLSQLVFLLVLALEVFVPSAFSFRGFNFQTAQIKIKTFENYRNVRFKSKTKEGKRLLSGMGFNL